jgi:hypothetical protein
MSNCRVYGAKPYQIALIHGGPGAAGSMQPCAQMLANTRGILEPIQTADTLEGQIEELRQTLEAYAKLPVILIGHSWGAMLSYLFTARYPSYVKKLIMVASAVFDASYAQHIMETRLNRLSPEKRIHLDELENQLQNKSNHSDQLFFQLGKMIEAADTFDPLTVTTSAIIPGQYQIYQQVWPQAEAMRATGELLTVGKNIDCPVVITHHLFLDNAGYHKSKEFAAWISETKIKLHYLPPYSPNLNPIERLWKVMHEQVTYNHYYEKFFDFKEAILEFFQEIGKYKNILQSRINDNFQKLTFA